MTSLSVHIYINGAAVNVCEFNKTKSHDFRTVVLHTLKPLNKNHYLELDMDSNEEYAIITCTNEDDKTIPIPSDVTARANKYIGIPWTHGSMKILLSHM
jgi:hypothetical protein